MAFVTTSKTWLKNTSKCVRDVQLVAVDTKLAQHESYRSELTRLALENALNAWLVNLKKEKKFLTLGPEARDAVNVLREDLSPVNLMALVTDDQAEMLDMLDKERKEFLNKFFTGTYLASESFGAVGIVVGTTANSIKTISDDAKIVALDRRLGSGAANAEAGTPGNVAKLGNAAQGFLSNAWEQVIKHIDDPDLHIALKAPGFAADLSKAIGISLDQLGVAMVAGAGLASSSIGVIYQAYKVGKLSLDSRTLSSSMASFNSGEPQEALQAVSTIIDREIARNTLYLTTYIVETVGKVGGMFLDGGAVTTAVSGFVATMSRLIASLIYMARDWYERYKANEILKNPAAISSEIFKECPILGCYFLCSANTSVVVSLLFRDIVLNPSFKDKIDKAIKKDIGPTLKIASHAMLNHRFRLVGKDMQKITVLGGDQYAKSEYLLPRGDIALYGKSTLDAVEAHAKNLVTKFKSNDRLY